MRNIAIIPARSGSKGLINKNIMPLRGKPLIAYTIGAALQSGVFSTVMVSTDSEEYAKMAKQYGAEVPFLRSQDTASDTASSWAVVKEVLEEYKKRGFCYDAFMLLQPTSPLRTADDIVDAYRELEEKEADSIVSVCEAEHSPLLANVLPEDMSLKNFLNQNSNRRRQELAQYYRLNGAIYLSTVDSFLKNEDLFNTNCYALIMDKTHSVDIDDEYDFIVAEAILSKQDGRLL